MGYRISDIHDKLEGTALRLEGSSKRYVLINRYSNCEVYRAPNLLMISNHIKMVPLIQFSHG